VIILNVAADDSNTVYDISAALIDALWQLLVNFVFWHLIGEKMEKHHYIA